LDENKKEYIKNKGRVPQEFVHHTIKQINKGEKRKNKEHNLKKNIFLTYIKNLIQNSLMILNKEKVKNQYQERKTNNGNISPPPQIIEKVYRVNEYIGNKLNNEYENRKKIIITYLLLHRS
jgi:hypothetical protein